MSVELVRSVVVPLAVTVALRLGDPHVFSVCSVTVFPLTVFPARIVGVALLPGDDAGVTNVRGISATGALVSLVKVREA